MKYQLDGKIIKNHFGLRVKTYSYLIDEVAKIKRKNAQKIKLKSPENRNCKKATQHENNINHIQPWTKYFRKALVFI